MRQRGFAAVALLGSPWLWLAISAALLSLTGWQLWESWQREAKARGEHAAFVEQVKRRAKEIQDENARLEEQWKSALAAQRASAARDRNALRAELDRVRNRPVDPGGREIPITAARGPVPDGVPAKLVPLADYESLQERAANDALTLTQLQDYVQNVCLAR